MRRSAAVLILGVAILAGACSSDDDGGSAANTSIPDPTTTASTTTEPRTVAPDIIPDDESQIDEAYVEGVLDALFVASLRALTDVRDVHNGVIVEEVSASIDAISTSAESAAIQNSLATAARSGFEGVPAEPSPIRATVVEVMSASKACIFAEVSLDTSGVGGTASEPSSELRQFAELHVASIAQRDSGLNPTAWVIAGLPVRQDGTVPEDPCAG